MVKKVSKKAKTEEFVIPVLYTEPKFYVYYDNTTGNLLSVTNEKTDRYNYGFEVDLPKVENFLNGKWKFADYLIGYVRSLEGKTVLDIIPRYNEEYSFRNNIFEWIKHTDEDSDLVVEWSLQNKTWTFKVKDGIIDQYKNLVTPRLVFFVTLEDDFDFLIRTIYVDMERILEEDVIVPFESDLESKIDKISISSKLVFNSYSLRIVNE